MFALPATMYQVCGYSFDCTDVFALIFATYCRILNKDAIEFSGGYSQLVYLFFKKNPVGAIGVP